MLFLDDGLRVPGTSLRVGADALIGLVVPGVGDAVSAVSALSLFWLAVERRVPKLVLTRMLLNVAIDTLVGAVPVLGDAFDLVFKANRRNLTLIEQHGSGGTARAKPPGIADYALVSLAVLVLVISVALPFIVAGWLLSKLF